MNTILIIVFGVIMNVSEIQVAESMYNSSNPQAPGCKVWYDNDLWSEFRNHSCEELYAEIQKQIKLQEPEEVEEESDW